MTKLVNFQGQTLRDDDLDAWRHEEAKYRREGEPFTASTDCPDCGVMDVHWLDEPRIAPTGNDPVSRAQRRISNSMETLMFGAPLFDQPGSTVMRICRRCSYRWGQS